MEILEKIKEAVPKEFIVGIRLGAFEPALADGIRHAKLLEEHGIDFLDISYGFSGEDEPGAPKDFPYKDVIHAAGEIKKHVSVPVFGGQQHNGCPDGRRHFRAHRCGYGGYRQGCAGQL